MNKLRVGILFGGRSGEHEVSLLSAASVLKAIDRDKYEVTPIGITREGRWVTDGHAELLLSGSSTPRPLDGAQSVLVPAAHGSAALIPLEAENPDAVAQPLGLDVIFPVMHGTYGEDGTIQGLLELAGIAYVGAGVLGSAAGMDKDVMKRLFTSANLPVPKHLAFTRAEWKSRPEKLAARIEDALKFPLFVKPANGGSSVGISKAHDRDELGPAIDLAAKYDRKIVVEQAVGGRKKQGRARELEVAVLGNDTPEASVVGEIVPAKEFYDYEAKYESAGSELILPAMLTRRQANEIRAMAIAAFEACECSGLARVDFLMEPGKRGRVFLNEINTLPGFTSISMYPKLWAASGLPYPQLIDKLIALALERQAERAETTYTR
jgi:D-alanine-D-alanine ligase